MTKLQFLNVFLTERLMLAAQEIYKSVEDTILEYQEEIAIRERENDHLRRRLRDAGIEIWPDRPSMALLDEEDGEHPRREWSPSMGHEERIPIQIKDKRDLRPNQGDDQLRGHGSCSTPENMFTPPRVGNEYPQE
ncbi:zinc finger protein 285-like protein, partial [Lates japonicus]